MATTRNADFQTLLNEYLPNKLLEAEMMKRDFFLSNIEMDDGATSGKVIIPWKSAGASSIAFNSLTAASDVSQSAFLRGSITSLPEIWGTMLFNSADLQDHSGKIPETTFLKILPNEIDDFVTYFRDVVSIQATTGPHFALALGDGQAGGTIVVNHIDRFQIGQKASLDDDNSSPVSVYVTAVDVNTGAVAGYPGSGTVTVSATRGGAALDISAYTTAQNAKFYHDGVWDGSAATVMTSIKNALLSSALGGGTTLHGKTKATYPVLQATLVSGASATATNLLDTIFDAVTAGRAKNRSNADTVVLSYKHLGTIFKILEVQKGAYRVVSDAKTLYGWTELVIGSVKGNLKIVGVMEMEDSEIFILDMKSMKFYSNGAVFKKQKSPDGNEYTVVRNTTGFQYLLDISFQAELGHLKPSSNIVIYSIPAY